MLLDFLFWFSRSCTVGTYAYQVFLDFLHILVVRCNASAGPVSADRIYVLVIICRLRKANIKKIVTVGSPTHRLSHPPSNPPTHPPATYSSAAVKQYVQQTQFVGFCCISTRPRSTDRPIHTLKSNKYGGTYSRSVGKIRHSSCNRGDASRSGIRLCAQLNILVVRPRQRQWSRVRRPNT